MLSEDDLAYHQHLRSRYAEAEEAMKHWKAALAAHIEYLQEKYSIVEGDKLDLLTGAITKANAGADS
jgi:hypothetical protein